MSEPRARADAQTGFADEGRLGEVRELVREARGILILTGAGVSADSGVPTFRSADGLWGEHRPEDLATPEAFARDPRMVWEWYEGRRRAVLQCEPNEGHRAIARLLSSREDVLLVTQNVDGLHHRATDEEADGNGPTPAGWNAQDRILELHGSLLRSKCSRCAWAQRECQAVDTESVHTLPRCPSCAELMRPDVVWFGEALDQRVLERAFEAAEASQLSLVVGTSALVYPAAGIPLAAREAGGAVVEVNPDSTPLTSSTHVSLRGRSADLLPALLGLDSQPGGLSWARVTFEREAFLASPACGASVGRAQRAGIAASQ